MYYPGNEPTDNNVFPMFMPVTGVIRSITDFSNGGCVKLFSIVKKDGTVTDFIVDSNFPGINSVLSDVIPEMINSVAFGNSSVEDALAKAQKSTQKIVDKYNK